jgi:hypothetical protein
MSTTEELTERVLELETELEGSETARAQLTADCAALRREIRTLDLALDRVPAGTTGSSVVVKVLLGVFFVPLAGLFGAVSGIIFAAVVVLIPILSVYGESKESWPLALMYLFTGVGAGSGVWLALREARRS